MLSLKPLCLTAAVALALAGTSALAATSTARLSGAGTTTSTTAGTTSTTGTTSTSGTTTTTGTVAGGCAGSNGSSCTATTSADTSNAGATTTTGSTVTSTNTPPGVFGGSGTSTSTTPASSGDTVPPVRSGQGTNSVNADPTFSRPGAFDPGGAFGPTAVPATTTNGTGTLEGGIVLPTTGTTTGGSQQNVFVQPSAQQGATVLNSTPIFDQAARNGQAREARRRAAGDEPRVIGIAPRTERDLTWQMPDDPIIRY